VKKKEIGYWQNTNSMNKKLEKRIEMIIGAPDIADALKVNAIRGLLKEEMWELQEAFCNSIKIMWDDNTQDFMTNWINRRYK
jgi:hypothetical protein